MICAFTLPAGLQVGIVRPTSALYSAEKFALDENSCVDVNVYDALPGVCCSTVSARETIYCPESQLALRLNSGRVATFRAARDG